MEKKRVEISRVAYYKNILRQIARSQAYFGKMAYEHFPIAL